MTDKIELAGASFGTLGIFGFLVLMTRSLANVGLQVNGALRPIFLIASLIVALGGFGFVIHRRFL